MRLRADQLAGHLAKPLSALYVLHGDELLTIEAADAVRAAARQQGYDERNVFVVMPNFRWDEVQLAADNFSLFGGSKLVDLRVPSLKLGQKGSREFQAALQQLCESSSAGATGVVTMITLPELDWQTRKTKWFGLLEEAAVCVESEAPPLGQLPGWIAQRLARQQQSAPRAALEFIAARVEGNLLAAHQEIQKLGLLYGEGELTLKQVEEAVLNVARYEVDDLRSALKARDIPRMARTLEGLQAEGAPPPLVLWAMASEARQNKSRGALLHSARVDRKIKGLTQGDLWDEFLQLGLRLSR